MRQDDLVALMLDHLIVFHTLGLPYATSMQKVLRAFARMTRPFYGLVSENVLVCCRRKRARDSDELPARPR